MVQRHDAGEAPHAILIVSNRLPVTMRLTDGSDFTLERSTGGLATALARLHAEQDSLWVGWPGEPVRSVARKQRLERLLRTDHRCVPVFLSARDSQLYYDGFSNRALWPLFHSFQTHVRYHDEEWEAYVQVNRAFCEVIVQEARGAERIWVHDYHLLLLPAMLRESFAEARIGFFLQALVGFQGRGFAEAV